MSAFVCSEKHISTIVSYGVQHEVGAYVPGPSGQRSWQTFKYDPQRVAEILNVANVDSVNMRYGDDHAAPGIRYKGVATAHMSHAQIIKLCDCFDYQACEVDGYDNSLAAQLISAVRDAAIEHLPGYADAAWSI